MKERQEINETKEDVKELKESFAMEVLQYSKQQQLEDANKRLFVMWLITFLALIGVCCYLGYVLNDIGTIETTRVEQSDADNNNYIGNDGSIINGTKDN